MKFTNVSGGLRNILKSRNITYKDIADKLDMSESGVKKLLTSNDISFNKLSAILDILDMKLEDLLGVERKTYAKLTSAQEAFLLKHLQHFNFFVQLIHYNCNLEDLKKENPKVSKSKVASYIEDLKRSQYLRKVMAFYDLLFRTDFMRVQSSMSSFCADLIRYYLRI